ncbi:MAG: hypothetical protein F4X35_03025 [Alphaproteobacteria bacterium]|nr:hypothetical protein [Alphaproteobacteria bacterium]
MAKAAEIQAGDVWTIIERSAPAAGRYRLKMRHKGTGEEWIQEGELRGRSVLKRPDGTVEREFPTEHQPRASAPAGVGSRGSRPRGVMVDVGDGAQLEFGADGLPVERTLRQFPDGVEAESWQIGRSLYRVREGGFVEVATFRQTDHGPALWFEYDPSWSADPSDMEGAGDGFEQFGGFGTRAKSAWHAEAERLTRDELMADALDGSWADRPDDQRQMLDQMRRDRLLGRRDLAALTAADARGEIARLERHDRDQAAGKEGRQLERQLDRLKADVATHAEDSDGRLLAELRVSNAQRKLDAHTGQHPAWRSVELAEDVGAEHMTAADLDALYGPGGRIEPPPGSGAPAGESTEGQPAEEQAAAPEAAPAAEGAETAA